MNPHFVRRSNMRTHYKTAGLIFALALAITLMAAAQTSSSQSSSQGQATRPSQSTPSTQPGTQPQASPQAPAGSQSQTARSEERRVGKECRYRRWSQQSKKSMTITSNAGFGTTV